MPPSTRCCRTSTAPRPTRTSCAMRPAALGDRFRRLPADRPAGARRRHRSGSILPRNHVLAGGAPLRAMSPRGACRRHRRRPARQRARGGAGALARRAGPSRQDLLTGRAEGSISRRCSILSGCGTRSRYRAGAIVAKNGVSEIWRAGTEAQVQNLKGKVAWVTGAGSGIGEAARWRSRRKGATVVLTGRRSRRAGSGGGAHQCLGRRQGQGAGGAT